MVFAGHSRGCFPHTKAGDPGSEFGRGGGHLQVSKRPTWLETWKTTLDVPDPLRSLDHTLFPAFSTDSPLPLT